MSNPTNTCLGQGQQADVDSIAVSSLVRQHCDAEALQAYKQALTEYGNGLFEMVRRIATSRVKGDEEVIASRDEMRRATTAVDIQRGFRAARRSLWFKAWSAVSGTALGICVSKALATSTTADTTTDLTASTQNPVYVILSLAFLASLLISIYYDHSSGYN